MTMRRKAGWYWAMIDGEWAPMCWDGETWKYVGARQNAITDVAARIPAPDEPWQCVPVEPTPDMIFALDAGRAAYGSMRGGYRAMLEAARRATDGP